MEKNEVALRILCALVSNPERYKYISVKVRTGSLTQEQANEKNVNKAFKMAETFMKNDKYQLPSI